MSSPERRAARIVIALDVSGPADYLLEIAQYAPAGKAAELVGLFIEDARLLRYTRSRLTREIVTSGGVRPLQRPALERQIRAQAAQVRRHFETAAARLGLRHAFRIARGELVNEWIRGAAEAEALVVGLSARSDLAAEARRKAIEQLAQAGLPAVLLARPGWSAGRNVVAVLETPEQIHPVLGAAIRAAAQSRAPLSVIVTGDAVTDREHVAADLTRTLGEQGISLPATAVLTRADARRIAQTADVANARLLVLAGGPTARADVLDTLLAETRAALLLVRTE